MAVETLRRLMEPRVHARDLLDMQAYAAQSALLLAFYLFQRLCISEISYTFACDCEYGHANRQGHPHVGALR